MQSFRFVTSFYRKLRHVPFVEHLPFIVQVFSVFTVYFCTNLELCFSFKSYRNTQVVGKVCFICVYALATSMIIFETSLPTLPMEKNVAFCAHTSFIFFLHTLHRPCVVAGPRKWFASSKRTSIKIVLSKL